MDTGMRKKCFVLALSMIVVLLAGAMAWGDVAINSENFPDERFRDEVKDDFDTNHDNILSDSEIAAATSYRAEFLIASKTPRYIKSLKGIEYLTALMSITCLFHKVSEVDLSKNTALTNLSLAVDGLTKLDLSKNTALTTLECDEPDLTELDLSNNTALTTLRLSGYGQTEIDLSKNTALTTLECKTNKLTKLDLSKNTALTTLECEENQLTELDLSKNTALKELNCNRTSLTKLDVSKNLALTELVCYYNQITELDMSNNTALTRLVCRDNQLTKLDVSKNTALAELFCYDNRLTELDVNNNTALKELNCTGNQLMELDVSNNTALTYLRCSSQTPKITAIGIVSQIRNADYPYVMDLNSPLLGISNPQDFISRISDVSVSDDSGNDVKVSTDESEGYIYFSARPKTMKYNYKVPRNEGKAEQQMDVTVTFEDFDNGADPDDDPTEDNTVSPLKKSSGGCDAGFGISGLAVLAGIAFMTFRKRKKD